MSIRIAAACAALLAALPALAQSARDAIVVTPSRFASADPKIAGHVSVLDRAAIAASPALTLPDLLRPLAGVEVRSLYGSLATDATVDLRGFGESAGSNTLVLLDGQRLSPIDLGSVIWNAVPLEGVQRIEVLRGAGSVLYGDRAVAGVVNIVTDKSGAARASAQAAAGDFGYRALAAQLAGGNEAAYASVFANAAQAEGWRDNNQTDSVAASGRVGLRIGADGEAAVDYAAYRESNGLPGALFRAQYETDPAQARTPLDVQRRYGWRLRPGVDVLLGERLALQAEVQSERQRLLTDSPAGGFREARQRDTLAFTPRLRWTHGLDGRASETVIGADWFDGDVEARSLSSFVGANTQTARQRGSALYALNTTSLGEALHLTLGARHQRVRQSAADAAAALAESARRSRNAAEAGLSAQLDAQWRAWVRVARVFRFPSTDELFGFDPVSFAPVFRGDLRPQQGTHRELGGAWRGAQFGARVALYELALSDEIGFDNVSFTNTNLPRTRRRGLEAEFDWAPIEALRLQASATLQQAQLRAGANAGRRIPLVAARKGSLAATWRAGALGAHTAALHYVGPRTYAGDFANVRGTTPGYATIDWRSSWEIGAWELSLRVLNALDRRYAPFAGYSDFSNDYFYFPADPRSVVASARVRFR